MCTSNADPTRAKIDAASVEAPAPHNFHEISNHVKDAINAGDRLPNTPDSLNQRASRRALIFLNVYKIAPQYKEPGQDPSLPLPATAHDVMLIYNMLIDSGYESGNIRILCDACKSNGVAHPTRENIIDSLDWLVSNTRSGDYRFLHFSGHGDRDESETNDDLRKEARIVPEGVSSGNYGEVPRDDYELAHQLAVDGPPIRQERQEVPKEVRYYKEAILTRISEADDDEDPGNVSRVWDNELNARLSKLHEDSTITCIMDCCASGRILNLPDKVIGAGFRGKPARPVVQGNTGSSDPALAADEGPAADSTSSADLEPQNELEDDKWREEIPSKERRLNGIKANIVGPILAPTGMIEIDALWQSHWSGCHQHQNSHNVAAGACSAGALTRAFAHEFRILKAEMPNGFNHEELHNRVSETVAGQVPKPQFVQLWTAFKNNNEHKDRYLNSVVVL